MLGVSLLEYPIPKVGPRIVENGFSPPCDLGLWGIEDINT
mgnify:CR=1 FL=1